MLLDIRPYTPADQEDLLQFFGRVLPELGFQFDPDAKDQDVRNIPDMYQSAGGLFLLARHDGFLIGTVALRQLEPGTCELKRFYVLAGYRRRGVGAALLDKVIAHAESGRWSKLRLDTSSKSPAAIALFKKRGFADIPRYNGDPFAEVFLELNLT